MRNGRLITIEGIGGSERTAHLHHLAQYLIDAGQTVLDLREPLCTKASRQAHHSSVIQNAINGGCIVLAEGFFNCEITWRDLMPDVSFKALTGRKKVSRAGIKPDLSFILESDLGVAWADSPACHQPTNAGQINDWINSETFYKKAEACWMEMIAQADWPVYLIPAAQSVANIQRQIIYYTNRLLDRGGSAVSPLYSRRSAGKTAVSKLIGLRRQAAI